MIVDASGLLGAWKLGILGEIPEPKTVNLIFYELGNVFWKMERRQSDVWTVENYLLLLRYINSVFLLEAPTFEEVLVLAKKKGLSFYDASYLWLAMKYREPILTLDKDFEGKWLVVHPEELNQS